MMKEGFMTRKEMIDFFVDEIEKSEKHQNVIKRIYNSLGMAATEYNDSIKIDYSNKETIIISADHGLTSIGLKLPKDVSIRSIIFFFKRKGFGIVDFNSLDYFKIKIDYD